MRLTLLRHGIAHPESPTGDFGRELSLRGIAQAREAAKALQADGPLPDRILSSPAHRTLQTARQVVADLGLSAHCLQEDPRLYLATTQSLLDILHEIDPTIDHLMVVGHNPGLSQLAGLLGAHLPSGELATGERCTVTVAVSLPTRESHPPPS